MQNKIIEYLKEEYNAKAILLHGSRARGNPHKQSDWDLLVFTDEIIKGNGGAKLDNEDLDIKVVKLPILDMDKFLSSYPLSLQTTKLLLDTDEGIANKIIDITKEKYNKGPGITEERKGYINSHFERMLSRLINLKNNPQMFFYHLSQFYVKTIRYWFEYQNRWSQPIAEALKIMEKEDQVFMNGVNTISDESKSMDEKINAAEKMVNAILEKK